ncbi:hypothetical protein QQM79_19945 [Marinobacteraceae bacterium S3BR75-40.1]
MTYPEYKKDLQHIHESEAYGLAVFDTAARISRNADHKEKWLVLKALEKQTLDRYLHYMQATGQPVTEPTWWTLKGRAEGAALGLMPWRLAMKFVRDATGPFQKRFLRLKRNAEGDDRAFFDYIYAHEKALESFAQKELAGDRNSLQAVETLLGR